jgi:hypothetical protein
MGLPIPTEKTGIIAMILVKLSGGRTAFGCNSGKSSDAEGANPHRVNLSGKRQSAGRKKQRSFFMDKSG